MATLLGLRRGSAEPRNYQTGIRELLTPAYFFFEEFFCASALPAADFDAVDVRPSRSVLDAAVAAADEVELAGALRWDRALPAADLEALPVSGLDRVLEALLAAVLEVTTFLAMRPSFWDPTSDFSRAAQRRRNELLGPV